MTEQMRVRHAVLILAAVRAEATSGRLDDEDFRRYVLDLTSTLELPEPAHA